MRFSKDGMFLAAGGQDHIVRVWKVLGSDSSVENQQQQHTIHVFESKPVCEFHGHTGDILDLCWSKVGVIYRLLYISFCIRDNTDNYLCIV